MVQIGNVSEINAVKTQLEELQANGLIEKWELPYENILTRLDAAIFFLTPADQGLVSKIWEDLRRHGQIEFRENTDAMLSQLEWRFEFKNSEDSP